MDPSGSARAGRSRMRHSCADGNVLLLWSAPRQESQKPASGGKWKIRSGKDGERWKWEEVETSRRTDVASQPP